MITGPEAALQALREYAQALRGDWSDFDGRSNKHTLEEFADAIEGKTRTDWTVERWRQDNDICPVHGDHWLRHCSPARCNREPSRW